ncbi:TetR/AcrR family transcriptional regulator [Pseudonocardia halophobica]|uniref:TetR/AcrR family transcriptional regulator n=1 Tax=Pseudonocardia halophobica TaxID=29401 RepID=UPI0009DF223A|nr:TetR/AcrR family transcriptional regulator [Pseudonocardia halophobica]
MEPVRFGRARRGTTPYPDGYARTSVDAVAREAGVSKRTVYDYYGDKRTLFLDVVTRTQAGHEARFRELLDETLPPDPPDLEAALTAFGRAFASGVVQTRERSAMVRLVVAEAAHFPDLLERWREVGPQQQMLADRLAHLAERGLLDIPDPVEAAAYLGILVTAQVNNRTLYGTLPISPEELADLVASGIRVFLRAYRPTAD